MRLHSTTMAYRCLVDYLFALPFLEPIRFCSNDMLCAMEVLTDPVIELSICIWWSWKTIDKFSFKCSALVIATMMLRF